MPHALLLTILFIYDVLNFVDSVDVYSNFSGRLSCKNMHTLWELIDWAGTNVSQSDSYRRIGEELVRLGKMRVHVDISGVVPSVLSRHDSTRNGFECAWYTPTYFFEFRSARLAAAFGSETSVFSDNTGRDTLSDSNSENVMPTDENNRAVFFCLPPTSNPQATASKTRTAISVATKISNGAPKVLASSFGCNGRADRNSTLKWMHAPKTGSSFAPTMEDLGYCSKGHTALVDRQCGSNTKERQKQPNACRIATMLRDPRQRLASNFYFNAEFCLVGQTRMNDRVTACFDSFIRTYFHPYGRGEKAYNGLKARAQGSVGRATASRKLLFAPTTNLWGCQTKMILGFECSRKISELPEHLRTSQQLIEHAKYELDRYFDFIGDTDSFDASVVLAHQQLGGQLDIFTSLSHVSVNPRVANWSASLQYQHLTGALADPWPRYYDCDFLQRSPKSPMKRSHFEYSSQYVESMGSNGPTNKHDPCRDEVDEKIYRYSLETMIANIMKYHDVPVRFIDSSFSPSPLDKQLPTESSLFEKGEYIDELTTRWRNFYKTPDSECTVLENWEGVARKAPVSFHKPKVGNKNSKFPILNPGQSSERIDMASVCERTTNLRESVICEEWKRKNQTADHGNVVSMSKTNSPNRAKGPQPGNAKVKYRKKNKKWGGVLL